MITAVVPARSGSKRLPGKNIKSLNGRPLIFHTLDAVVNHEEISKVVFSTDSEEYKKLVEEEYGEQVCTVRRPNEFASDTTKVHDEMKRLLEVGVLTTEWFMLCLPTSPLRTHKTVSNLLNVWRQDRIARFTASAYEFPIQFGFEIDKNGYWAPIERNSPMITGITRSQDIPTRYRPNGAIYINTTTSLLENRTFYINAKPFIISAMESTDVDTELDFVKAELMMKGK